MKKLSKNMLDHLRWLHEVTGPNIQPVADFFRYKSNEITHNALLRRGLIKVDPTTKYVTVTDEGLQILKGSK